MGFFDKKFDLQKDFLRIAFNLETKKYQLYRGFDLISYDDLNRKTKRFIDEKNKNLMIDESLLDSEIQKAKESLRFHKLKDMGYTCDSFEYLGPS